MRTPLISLLFLIVVVSVLWGFCNISSFAAPAHPNVILIYSDDQGSLDLGCYGTPDVRTPHIDSLARRGLRMTQMYAPAAICSPSRAGLLTGRIPPRAGLTHNVAYYRGMPGLPSDELTIAKVLQQNGYRTGHFGKWHLGSTKETMPNAHGFDFSFGHLGGCIDNFSHHFYYAIPHIHDLWLNGEQVWRNGEYFPQIVTDESLAFFEECQKKDQPFFAYVAYNVPHYPVQPTDQWREKYMSIQTLDVPLFNPISKTTFPAYFQGVPSVRGMYLAFIASMDEQVGRIVQKIDELGLRENTIIIFQADQGHSVEDRIMGGGGYTGQYRGHKTSLFEGGIRTPSVVSWPAHLPEGETRDQLLHACDWMPTLLSLCGAEVPRDRTIDGMDILPVLKDNAPTPHHVLYWQAGTTPQWAVRKDNWKLVAHPIDRTLPLLPEDREYFLVDLAKDPGERVNLAKSEPEIVAELIRLQETITQEIQEENRNRKQQ